MKKNLETHFSLEDTFLTVAVECSRMFQNSDSLVSETWRACETDR